ncbi:TetR/AcrR family transcriptional regulator [Agaribacter flavus]|uniref:TetR/AcrR family transcriptional regulator n=1 Tax=Agaribacter flavus TaxID=1902781 RepID=A0ABV7FRL2_9ALTE
MTTKSLGRPKSAEKRLQILQSAGQLFLSSGYERTSMDTVAKHSGVSKQTVYSHFANKDALFNAVIELKCITYQIDETNICIRTAPLKEILEEISMRFLALFTDPEIINMFTVIIGESVVNPHVSELFYKAGPERSLQLVAEILQAHPESALAPEQAREVAVDFFNLLEFDFHMKSLLHLPFDMPPDKFALHAKKTANKLIAIIRGC